ncbi:IPT/TIG domain-containing protein [Streptomyces sp. NPDC057460]|uniref:IPT/TIG domain-containing protein n=1 Tax=Streptomyces sp. NPDC057460 TaxID=3346141 RepID=UPI0036A52F9D
MPTLTSLTPTQSHNGITLTLTGTSLSGTTKVNFGTKKINPATVSATTVTVAIPAQCGGQVNVSVTAGTTTSNSLSFFYIDPPAPTALSANTGPATATSLSVLGSGLLTATAVTFGAVGDGTGLTVVSDSELTVTCPAHDAFGGASFDTVDCTVTTAGGTSIPLGAPTQYTYYDVPTVTSLAPTSGPVGDDTTVTGANLVDVSIVTFTPTAGGAAVQADFSSFADTTLVATVPSGLAAGTYNVRATTPGGQTAIVAGDVYTVD